MHDAIREAVGLLEPDNDAHWTKAGKPSLDVVSDIVGQKVTRAQIDETGVTRDGKPPVEPEDQLAALDAEIAAKQDEILEINREVGRLQRRAKELTEERRVLREQRQELRGPEVRAREYKRYLESVQEERRRRVENEQKIRELTGKRIDLGPPCNRPDPKVAQP